MREERRREEYTEIIEDANSEGEQNASFEEEYDQEKNNEEEIQEWEFPERLGRIPEFQNPVVELIKVILIGN